MTLNVTRQLVDIERYLSNVLHFGKELPPEAFRRMRRELELSCGKWDAQVGDDTALAPAPLLLGRGQWRELSRLARCLYEETVALEQELLHRHDLHAELGMPHSLRQLLRERPHSPCPGRVMRFDFHYTTEGWRISEVNSDVPGGYAEGTHLSRLHAVGAVGVSAPGDPTAALIDSLARQAGEGLTAMTCAPGFLEDQQVVSYLTAALRARGQQAELVSVHQLDWSGGRVRLSLPGGPTREVAAIFRFYQLEWLASLPAADFRWLIVGNQTRVLNPAEAAFTESKRLPLVWSRLRASHDTWQRLLPETCALSDAPWANDDRWLLKSAYCNNGDSVSIRSAMTPLEWAKRSFQARLRPRRWLAQRRFEVVPVCDEHGIDWLPCVGVYVVDGEAAGAYARVSRRPFIDFAARDAALLIYEDA
jgi:glutathionylspermidine synthase